MNIVSTLLLPIICYADVYNLKDHSACSDSPNQCKEFVCESMVSDNFNLLSAIICYLRQSHVANFNLLDYEKSQTIVAEMCTLKTRDECTDIILQYIFTSSKLSDTSIQFIVSFSEDFRVKGTVGELSSQTSIDIHINIREFQGGYIPFIPISVHPANRASIDKRVLYSVDWSKNNGLFDSIRSIQSLLSKYNSEFDNIDIVVSSIKSLPLGEFYGMEKAEVLSNEMIILLLEKLTKLPLFEESSGKMFVDSPIINLTIYHPDGSIDYQSQYNYQGVTIGLLRFEGNLYVVDEFDIHYSLIQIVDGSSRYFNPYATIPQSISQSIPKSGTTAAVLTQLFRVGIINHKRLTQMFDESNLYIGEFCETSVIGVSDFIHDLIPKSFRASISIEIFSYADIVYVSRYHRFEISKTAHPETQHLCFRDGLVVSDSDCSGLFKQVVRFIHYKEQLHPLLNELSDIEVPMTYGVLGDWMTINRHLEHIDPVIELVSNALVAANLIQQSETADKVMSDIGEKLAGIPTERRIYSIHDVITDLMDALGEEEWSKKYLFMSNSCSLVRMSDIYDGLLPYYPRSYIDGGYIFNKETRMEWVGLGTGYHIILNILIEDHVCFSKIEVSW